MSRSPLSIELVKKSGSLGSRLAPAEIGERPLTVGTTGELQLEGEGIATEHLLLLMKRGRLLAASVSAERPAFTEVAAIPTRWVELVVPCNVLVGDNVLRFSWTSERPVSVEVAASEPTVLAALPTPATMKPPRDDVYEHTLAYARPPVAPLSAPVLPAPTPPAPISSAAAISPIAASVSMPTFVAPAPFLRTPRPPTFAFPPPVRVIERTVSARPIGGGVVGIVLGYLLHMWRSLVARTDDAPQSACHDAEVRSKIPA